MNTKKPSIFAICGAFILSLIFLISFIPAILAAPLEFILFNPNPYNQLLSQPDLQSELPRIILAQLDLQIFSNPQIEISPIFEQPSTFIPILDSGITSNWIEQEFASVIKQLISFFNIKSPNHQLTVDMNDYKNELRAKSITTTKVLLNELPHCDPAQEEIIKSTPMLTLKEMPVCRPSTSLTSKIQILIQNGIEDITTKIPAQIQIIELLPINSQIFTYYSLLRWIIRLSPLLVLSSLLGISVFLRKSRKLMLGWIGWLLCVPSLLFFIVIGTILIGFNQFVSLIFNRITIIQNIGFSRIVLPGLQLIGFQFSVWVFITLFMLLFAGLLLIIAAKSIRIENKPDFLEDKRKLIEEGNSALTGEVKRISKSRKNNDI